MGVFLRPRRQARDWSTSMEERAHVSSKFHDLLRRSHIRSTVLLYRLIKSPMGVGGWVGEWLLWVVGGGLVG